MQVKQTAPRIYRHVHDFQVQDYHVLFNAKADMFSFALLNQREFKWFKALQAQQDNPSLITRLFKLPTTQRFAATLRYLEQKNIIHRKAQEPTVDVSPGKAASIWLHVSNQCNLRCTYCYIEKTNDHLDLQKGKLYTEKAFQLLRDRGMQTVNVKLAGGEPTLRFEQSLKLIDYVRELGPKYGLEVDVILLTNGTLLTADKAKILREKNINVSVSLDGIDESNNKNRPYIDGRGSLHKVMDGIALLQEHKVNFNVSVVITPETIDHFPEVIKFCLKRKIKYLIQFARDNTFSVGDVQADNAKLIEGMRRVFNVIRADFPQYSLLQGHLDNVSFSRAHTEPVCGVDNNYLVISEEGEVSACHMFMDQPVGSILDNDISAKLFGAMPVTQGISSEKKSGCGVCEWRYVCAGSCPATTKLTYGTAGRQSPFCEAYKTLIPELLKLEGERLISLAKNAR